MAVINHNVCIFKLVEEFDIQHQQQHPIRIQDIQHRPQQQQQHLVVMQQPFFRFNKALSKTYPDCVDKFASFKWEFMARSELARSKAGKKEKPKKLTIKYPQMRNGQPDRTVPLQHAAGGGGGELVTMQTAPASPSPSSSNPSAATAVSASPPPCNSSLASLTGKESASGSVAVGSVSEYRDTIHAQTKMGKDHLWSHVRDGIAKEVQNSL